MLVNGMDLDAQVGKVIRCMPQVDGYRETLSHLQSTWDNLSLLGELSGVGGG